MLDFRPVDPVAPIPLCIEVETACNWIRLDSGNEIEDDIVEGLIRSAMAWAESFCHQPLFSRDFYGFSDCLANTCLHSLNVTAVSKVEYQTVGSRDWTELDSDHFNFWESGEVFFYDVAGIRNISRIRITYKAGYETGAVPHDILQAIRLLIGRWYEKRADEKKEIPSAAEWLVQAHRLSLIG